MTDALAPIAVVALATFLIVRAVVSRKRRRKRKISITVEWDDGNED